MAEAAAGGPIESFASAAAYAAMIKSHIPLKAKPAAGLSRTDVNCRFICVLGYHFPLDKHCLILYN